MLQQDFKITATTVTLHKAAKLMHNDKFKEKRYPSLTMKNLKKVPHDLNLVFV